MIVTEPIVFRKPTQKDSYNCGIYVSVFFEAYLYDVDMTKILKTTIMEYLRYRMVCIIQK